MAANLPNGNFLRWIVDNLPALGAALAAAGAVLMTFRRRTVWVWIYAISTFFVTLFSQSSAYAKEEIHTRKDEGHDQEGGNH